MQGNCHRVNLDKSFHFACIRLIFPKYNAIEISPPISCTTLHFMNLVPELIFCANNEHWILDNSLSVHSSSHTRRSTHDEHRFIHKPCIHSSFGFSCAFDNLQQAVQEPHQETIRGYQIIWYSSISRPERLHCAGLFSNPMVSQGSLTQKALDVKLLPLSPTANVIVLVNLGCSTVHLGTMELLTCANSGRLS